MGTRTPYSLANMRGRQHHHLSEKSKGSKALVQELRENYSLKALAIEGDASVKKIARAWWK